jgi:hypothetical protein
MPMPDPRCLPEIPVAGTSAIDCRNSMSWIFDAVPASSHDVDSQHTLFGAGKFSLISDLVVYSRSSARFRRIMNQHPQLIVNRDPTQPAPPSFRHLTKPDTLPRSLSESVDSRNQSCVRVLVWAFLFEGALVMTISARWWLPRLIH